MKKRTLLGVLALVMAFAFALTGCGGSDGGDSAASVAEEGDTLKVVTNATFKPFEFTEDGAEEIIGFDVDMMNAIAEDQGLKIEFVNMEFDSLIPALESNQGDIIWNLCGGGGTAQELYEACYNVWQGLIDDCNR